MVPMSYEYKAAPDHVLAELAAITGLTASSTIPLLTQQCRFTQPPQS